MKPKYTPGEWSYETRKLFTDMEPQVYVYKPGYRVIADMPGPGIRTGVESLEERQANARLIAAAPELLEALKLLLTCVYEKYNLGDAQSPEELKARAAIAKAEGVEDLLAKVESS